jgi:hypothetical protein
VLRFALFPNPFTGSDKRQSFRDVFGAEKKVITSGERNGKSSFEILMMFVTQKLIRALLFFRLIAGSSC